MVEGEERLVVAETAEATYLAVNGKTTIELTLPVAEQGDLVPLTVGSNLYLEILQSNSEPGANLFSINLLPGAKLSLPLLEYQDPIPMTNPQAFWLRAPKDLIRAPPGSELQFAVEVVSNATDGLRIDLEVIGAGKDWNPRLSPRGVTVSAKGTETAILQLTVPANATDHTQFPIFVAGRSPKISGSALIELRVVIDSTAPVPGLQDFAQKSPTPGFVQISGLLVLLAALSLHRANRRLR